MINKVLNIADQLTSLMNKFLSDKTPHKMSQIIKEWRMTEVTRKSHLASTWSRVY